ILSAQGMCNGTGFIDAVTLPVNGTYSVRFDPYSTRRGTATLTLYLFTDVTGALSPNNTTTVNISYPGQNWVYTCSGMAGQQASVNVTNWTDNQCYYGGNFGTVYLLKPDGTTLAAQGMCNGTGFIDAVTLPATGSYTVKFDPY